MSSPSSYKFPPRQMGNLFNRHSLTLQVDAIHTQNAHNLNEPFSKIFVDYAEAEWAFDLLRETTRRLRVSNPYDPRVAATLSTRSGRPFLHLNFGNWLVLGFRGPGLTPVRVDMALLAELVTWDERFNTLPSAPKEGEPEVRSYELPIEVVRPLTSDLQRAFNTTLDFIADKFADWKRNPHWKQHNPELIEAFFDTEKRAQLFADGMDEPVFYYERHLTAFDSVIAEEGEEYNAGDEEMTPREDLVMETDSYFTAKTFELLDSLHKNPTKDFYDANKKDFQKHVEEPFQNLLRTVATHLPPQITDVMETEKRLFSRITKNDFGQGGAWDFYWGAFYPKDGKRTEDAQLSMWINFERFEFGFFIGRYGTKSRQRFIENCQKNYDALVEILHHTLSDKNIFFGSYENLFVKPDGAIESEINISWNEWLKNPKQGDFDVSYILTADRVINYPAEALIKKIAQIYTDIFPLILLATYDDPLSAIQEYIETLNRKSGISPKKDIYPLAQLAEDTGFDEATLSRWVRAIERKGQAILYGPPGTGKTFIAEKLAAHLTGGGDGFVDLVQFHPAYAYEDFIQGLRPTSRREGGLDYRLTPGRFLEFCTKAQGRTDRCVLIIDEINRANLSRVFGELMYLLEYRKREIPLAGGKSFAIPANVRIIGTMNTADRSIALVDHALRRRFAFIALRPNFEVLRRYHQNQQTDFPVDGLIQVLTRLNQRIDEDYQVGITFFLEPDLVNHIEDIWRLEIEPYLEEYFFDQRDEINDFRWAQVQQEIMPS